MACGEFSVEFRLSARGIVVVVDYYSILAVSRTATQAEVKHAYRMLLKRWHPDVNDAPEASARTRAILEAYAVLGNRSRRSHYDRLLGDADRAAALRELVAKAQREAEGNAKKPLWAYFKDVIGPWLIFHVVVLSVSGIMLYKYARWAVLTAITGLQTGARSEHDWVSELCMFVLGSLLFGVIFWQVARGFIRGIRSISRGEPPLP